MRTVACTLDVFIPDENASENNENQFNEQSVQSDSSTNDDNNESVNEDHDPTITTRRNKVIPSKLWKKILQYTKNDRKAAKLLYGISINKQIRAMFPNLRYDRNGEMTLKSLRSIANTYNIANSNRVLEQISKLQDEFGATNIESIESAIAYINKINDPNGEFGYNDIALAVVNQNSNGTFDVNIVENSTENRKQLKAFQKQVLMQKELLSKLKTLGVNVDFVSKLNFGGKYDTVGLNAERGLMALHTVISISKNLPITVQNKILSKEIGHFVVGVLGKDNNLIKRLSDIITPDFAREYAMAFESGVIGGAHMQREVMGHLIGEALYDRLDENPLVHKIQHSGIANLLGKIIAKIKSIFSKYKGETDFQSDILKIDNYVERAVDGFLNADEEYDLNKALEENSAIVEEVLYSAESDNYNPAYIALKNAVHDQYMLVKELRKYNKKDANALERALKDLVSNVQHINPSTTSVEDDKVIELAVGSLLVNLQADLADCITKLGQINGINGKNGMSDFEIDENLGDVARQARQLLFRIKYDANSIQYLTNKFKTKFSESIIKDTPKSKWDLFGGHVKDLTDEEVDSRIQEMHNYDNTDSDFSDIDERAKLYQDENGEATRDAFSYTRNDGKKSLRLHRLFEKNPKSEEEKPVTPDAINRMEKGTRVDIFLRSVFESKGLMSLENALAAANEYVDPNKSTDNQIHLTESDVKKLYYDTRSLMLSWKEKGIKWKANNLIFTADMWGETITGEADLLLKYPDGHLEVWDFKNSQVSDISKQHNWHTQVNFYAYALKQQFGDNNKARVGGIIKTNIFNNVSEEDRTFSLNVVSETHPSRWIVKDYNSREVQDLRIKILIDRSFNNAQNNDILETEDEAVYTEKLDNEYSKSTVLEFIREKYGQNSKIYESAIAWGSVLIGGMRRHNTNSGLLNFLGIKLTAEDFKKLNGIESNKKAMSLSSTLDHTNQMLDIAKTNISSLVRRLSRIWLSKFLGAEICTVRDKGIYREYDPKSKKRRFVVHKDVTTRTIPDLLDNLDRDITSFENMVSATGRLFDIPTQILSKMIDAANYDADQKAKQAQISVISLVKKYNLTNSQIKDLYERDGKNLTGYFKSKVHWGKYEKDVAAFKEKTRIDFEDYLRTIFSDDQLSSMSEDQRTAIWSTWYWPKYYEFHHGTEIAGQFVGAHSVKNNEGTLVPNPEIYGQYSEYSKLSENQKAFLQEILELKKSLDDCIGGANVTVLERAPQVVASAWNKLFTNTGDVPLWKNIRHFFNKFVKDNNEDIVYGNDQDEASSLSWFGEFDSEINKNLSSVVPTFFVRPLRDKNLLSTNIISSMTAYASMAYAKQSLEYVKDIAEIATAQMESRKPGQGPKRGERVNDTINESLFTAPGDNTVRLHKNLRSYLETTLYSRSPYTKVVSRLFSALSGFTSKLFLGGNIAGATVNLGTGIVEIFKEGFVGEDMGIENLTKANVLFFEALPQVLTNTVFSTPNPIRLIPGNELNAAKVAAWLRYCNARGDNAYQDKSSDIRQGRVRYQIPSLSDFIMFPYSAGDYYMQAISFLHDALKTKVVALEDFVDKETGEIKEYKYKSLLDVYSFEKGYITAPSSDTYFTKEFIEYIKESIQSVWPDTENPQRATYMFIHGLLGFKNQLHEKMIDNKYSDIILNFEDFITGGFSAQEIVEVLGLKTDQTSSSLYLQLSNLIEKGSVSKTFEVEYFRKCRELNDRMHGIYNKANKPGLDRFILGKSLLSMRGYLFGYIERDFASTRYDTTLKRQTEGTLTSIAKYIGYSFSKGTLNGIYQMLASSLLTTIASAPGINLISGRAYNKVMHSLEEGLGDFQINNFKRKGSQLWTMVVLMGIASLIAKSLLFTDDDDDDDEQYKSSDRLTLTQKILRPIKDANWLGFMLYIFSRVYYEQAVMSVVLGAGTETASDILGSGGDVATEVKAENYGAEFMRNASIVPIWLSGVFNVMEGIGHLLYGLLQPEPDVDEGIWKKLKDAGSVEELHVIMQEDPSMRQHVDLLLKKNHIELYEIVQKNKESDKEYEKRITKYVKNVNALYDKSHYKSPNASYYSGGLCVYCEDGKRVFGHCKDGKIVERWDGNPTKKKEIIYIMGVGPYGEVTYTNKKSEALPIHSTAWERAMYGEHAPGDPKVWTDVFRIAPFLRSAKQFRYGEESTEKYFYGQSRKQ